MTKSQPWGFSLGMNPRTDAATTTPRTERSTPTLDQPRALDQPPAPKLYPLLVPVILVPLRRRRPRPAVLDARPSGSRKAVRAEKPLLIEPRRRDVEPALRHYAAVPAPIFGGLSRLPSAVAARNVAVGFSLGCQRVGKALGFRNSVSCVSVTSAFDPVGFIYSIRLQIRRIERPDRVFEPHASTGLLLPASQDTCVSPFGSTATIKSDTPPTSFMADAQNENPALGCASAQWVTSVW
jgi:hypothetical protein